MKNWIKGRQIGIFENATMKIPVDGCKLEFVGSVGRSQHFAQQVL